MATNNAMHFDAASLTLVLDFLFGWNYPSRPVCQSESISLGRVIFHGDGLQEESVFRRASSGPSVIIWSNHIFGAAVGIIFDSHKQLSE